MRIAAIMIGTLVSNVVVLDDTDDLDVVANAHDADAAIDISDLDHRPGPGWTFEAGTFRPPPPFPSWVWSGTEWAPPTPRPDGAYRWDEDTLSWVEIPTE